MKFWPSAILAILSLVRMALRVDQVMKGIMNAFVLLAITASFVNRLSMHAMATPVAMAPRVKYSRRVDSGKTCSLLFSTVCP